MEKEVAVISSSSEGYRIRISAEQHWFPNGIALAEAHAVLLIEFAALKARINDFDELVDSYADSSPISDWQKAYTNLIGEVNAIVGKSERMF